MGINTKMHKINKFPIKTLLNKDAWFVRTFQVEGGFIPPPYKIKIV